MNGSIKTRHISRGKLEVGPQEKREKNTTRHEAAGGLPKGRPIEYRGWMDRGGLGDGRSGD